MSTYSTRLCSFGQGLAEGCSDKGQLFEALRDAFKKTPREERHINVILGFLSAAAESDSLFYNAKLDVLLEDEVLGKWFPILQATSTIGQLGIERLHAALDLGNAPIDSFRHLAWGRVHESINDDDLAELLAKILNKDNGVDVATEILQMRFHRSNEDPGKYSNALTTVAGKTLSIYRFDQKQRHGGSKDYALASIAAISLRSAGGAGAARTLAKNLADAIVAHQAYSFDYTILLNTVAELQPKIFLDEFLGREDMEKYQRQRLFSDDLEGRENPMRQIPDDIVISWCEGEPSSRYSNVMLAVEVFRESSKTDKLEWRPIVEVILKRAQDLETVLDQLGRTLRPSSWSGSLAEILEHRSVLLRDLCEHDNAEVASWARRQYARFQEGIVKEREMEGRRDRDRNESFE